MGQGFIRFEEKSGVTYGTHFVSKRIGTRVKNNTTYLGKVINKDKGIFHSRQRGYFSFTIESGFGEVSLQDQLEQSSKKEKHILLFGDA
jgi:hypothetical protein